MLNWNLLDSRVAEISKESQINRLTQSPASFGPNDVRNKRFVVSSIKDLFENAEAQNIIDFIK